MTSKRHRTIGILLSRYRSLILRVIFYLAIAMLIIGPALAPGYLFLLDMPWPTHIQISDFTQDGLQPHLPMMVLLKFLNIILPGWILQKCILLGVIIAAGLSMHALAEILNRQLATTKKTTVPQSILYASGLLAVLNPFVFERLAAGQWIVLAGYAYTPFLLYSYLKWRNSWRFWLAYALFPIISVHFWLMSTLVGTTALILFNRDNMLKVLRSGYFIALFMLINSFWLIALAVGNNTLASQLNQTNFDIFKTLGDPTVGVVGNVISLYGFWRPASSLKDEYLLWFLYGLLIVLLACVGIWLSRQKKQGRHKRLSVESKASIVVGILSLLFAVGASTTLTKTLTAPFTALPLAASLRESAKFVGLLALLFAFWAPRGVIELSKRFRISPTKSALALCAVTVIMMSGMFFGLDGKLSAVSYPDGWYRARELLSGQGTVLVLPWQGYLELEFAHDVYAANPAPVFFDSRVLTSKSTGNPSLDVYDDNIRQQLENYLSSDVPLETFASSLSPKPTHILILKTGNWERYERIIQSNPAIIMYQDSSVALIQLNK